MSGSQHGSAPDPTYKNSKSTKKKVDHHRLFEKKLTQKLNQSKKKPNAAAWGAALQAKTLKNKVRNQMKVNSGEKARTMKSQSPPKK